MSGGNPDQDSVTLFQVSMLKDLDLEIPVGSEPADIMEALCWAVVRPVANAMRGCERKRVPTIAAFVNTLLVPHLFDKQQVRVGVTQSTDASRATLLNFVHRLLSQSPS